MPDIPTEAREQLKTKVNRIADRRGSLRRSSTENDERGKLRKEIKDMGYSAEAFQPAVSIAKSMNRAEAEHCLTSLQFLSNRCSSARWTFSRRRPNASARKQRPKFWPSNRPSVRTAPVERKSPFRSEARRRRQGHRRKDQGS